MKSRIFSFVAVFTVAISISGVPACDRHSADQEIHDLRPPASSGSLLSNASHGTDEKDGSRHQTCTYYHTNGQGSVWKTTWC